MARLVLGGIEIVKTRKTRVLGFSIMFFDKTEYSGYGDGNRVWATSPFLELAPSLRPALAVSYPVISAAPEAQIPGRVFIWSLQ